MASRRSASISVSTGCRGPGCCSARGFDADRRGNLLTPIDCGGSLLRAEQQPWCQKMPDVASRSIPPDSHGLPNGTSCHRKRPRRRSRLLRYRRLLDHRDGSLTVVLQPFHQRVRSVWIAAATVLNLQTLNAIRHFERHNLFSRLHNLLQPELSRACRLGPRAAASLHRPALLGRQSGHKRSRAPWK